MANWTVKPDPMIDGYYMLHDAETDSTLAQVIDWHGIAYADREEAQRTADMLNQEGSNDGA